jgi:ribonuclease/clavin/mitogillin
VKTVTKLEGLLGRRTRIKPGRALLLPFPSIWAISIPTWPVIRRTRRFSPWRRLAPDAASARIGREGRFGCATLPDKRRGLARMPNTMDITIVNVGYRSTNVWVIGSPSTRLMVDLGWPGTMGTLRANLKRMDIALEEITHGLATHYHMDHAGLGQELKQAGMTLIVLEPQLSAIPLMKEWMKPQDNYVDISLEGNLVLSFADSRSMLETLGFPGEILHTPGHSDDSVSLLLDTGAAFTGDLTFPEMATDEQAGRVAKSWQRLRDRGARLAYPGHGPARPIPEV